MTVLIAIVLVITAIFIYQALPGGKLYRQYTNEVQLSFDEAIIQKQGSNFTGEAISGLPIPMQKYLSHCSYAGKPMMEYMYLKFIEANFAMLQDQKPIKIDYEQYNFVARPDRHAFIDAKIFGMHIINAKDTYVNGEGSMTIRLPKLFKVGNSNDMK